MRRRRLVRIIFFLIVVLLVAPFLIPTPPLGVEAATLADPDGFFIDVDGLSTYVLARGTEDGPPVMLLHGWGASTFTWRLNQDVLAEAGYRAIAFDRPPYGLSAKTGANIPYSPGALADFTAQVMDTLDIESAVMVGQSQGGAVIGHFALRYPERVEKLVFVSAALRPSDDPVAATGRGTPGFPPIVTTLLKFPPLERWAHVLIRAFVTPDFSTQILRSAYYDPAFMTPDVAEGYARQLRIVGWDEALLNQLKGSAFTAEPITADQIASITVPVMIAWGEDDTWVPISVGERLRELLPESLWHTYASVGHLPQEEAADSFNTDLLTFLSAS